MRLSRGIHHLLLGALTGLLAIGASAAYWAIVGSDALLARDDNPRRIEALAAIQRGSIVDREQQSLAETVAEATTLQRRYQRPSTFSAVGYYSLRYGASGAEAAFDAALAGSSEISSLRDFVDKQLLRLPQVGADVMLSLDADLQDALAAAIGDAPGAAVVLNAWSGEIVALVSQPSFDPNTLDEDWQALVADERQPFFNRALQGRYQLGGAMYTLLLAQAIASDFDLKRAFADAGAPIRFADGMRLACVLPPPRADLTLPEAYAYGCPAPFQSYFLAAPQPSLASILAPYRFDKPIALAGFPQPEGLDPSAAANRAEDEAAIIRAALGQGSATATPLHLALIMAAIATDGSAPGPAIQAATRPPSADQWHPTARDSTRIPMLSAETAAKLGAVLRQAWSVIMGASSSSFGAGGAQVARSQAGESAQIWLNGYYADSDGSIFAFIVLLEGRDQPSSVIALSRVLIEALAQQS